MARETKAERLARERTEQDMRRRAERIARAQERLATLRAMFVVPANRSDAYKAIGELPDDRRSVVDFWHGKARDLRTAVRDALAAVANVARYAQRALDGYSDDGDTFSGSDLRHAHRLSEISWMVGGLDRARSECAKYEALQRVVSEGAWLSGVAFVDLYGPGLLAEIAQAKALTYAETPGRWLVFDALDKDDQMRIYGRPFDSSDDMWLYIADLLTRTREDGGRS